MLTKIITLSILILVASGCGTQEADNKLQPEKTYKTIVIEGHEYIFIPRNIRSTGVAITHKANCFFSR